MRGFERFSNYSGYGHATFAFAGPHVAAAGGAMGPASADDAPLPTPDGAAPSAPAEVAAPATPAWLAAGATPPTAAPGATASTRDSQQEQNGWGDYWRGGRGWQVSLGPRAQDMSDKDRGPVPQWGGENPMANLRPWLKSPAIWKHDTVAPSRKHGTMMPMPSCLRKAVRHTLTPKNM